jgi:endonuclease G
MSHRKFAIFLGALCALVVQTSVALGQASLSVHLTLGKPSEATQDAQKTPDDLLMIKDQYALSYNRSKATANWVAWHLSKRDLGQSDRQNDFRADDALPNGWFRVVKADFDNTGFDCGHLCPSSDRTRSIHDNQATFLTTNMVPQVPKNNRVAWRGLEEYERKLVRDGGHECYIVAGPSGQGGRGSKGYKLRLRVPDVQHRPGGDITVPAAVWKVIVVLDDGPRPAGDRPSGPALEPASGRDDLKRVNKDTQVIAAVMPNLQSIAGDWPEYRASVKDVEDLTGLKFFSLIPTPIRHALEMRGAEDEPPSHQEHQGN